MNNKLIKKTLENMSDWWHIRSSSFGCSDGSGFVDFNGSVDYSYIRHKFGISSACFII